MTARYLWTLMLVAGCGRLDFNDQAPLPPDDTGTNDRVPPEVCWVTTWTQVAFAQTDIDVSVATTPNGVTVVWTPTSGGDLSGINLDRTWRLTANPGVIQPGSWLRSSVTWIADQLVTAEAETGGSVKIFTSQPDLSGGAEIGCPLASSVSKPPLVHAGSDTVLLTGWDSGLIVTPYDAALSAQPSMMAVTTAPALGLAATTVGATAVAAWSTVDGCYVEHVMDMATGIGAMSTAPCLAPRLAASSTQVALVFEGTAGIYVTVDGPETLDASRATLIAPGGSSPRIAFDGTRFWLTYLDGKGHVIIGHLAADGQLRTTSITTSPAHDAYELAIVDGAPWVFAVDGSGLAATMLCLGQ